MVARIAGLFRYPIKGLSAQELAAVSLTAGDALPLDRRFAILHPGAAHDAPPPMAAPDSHQPRWRPRSDFITLERCPRLAALATEFEEATATLVIRRGGRVVARGRLDQPLGRALIEQFLAAYLGNTVPGIPHLVEAPGGASFLDAPEQPLVIINTASVGEVERVLRRVVAPLRFRPSLLIDGEAPWAETGWIGRSLAVGGVRLAVAAAAECHPAAAVDPASGAGDLNIHQTLRHGFGRQAFGVLARVAVAGRLAIGDTVAVTSDDTSDDTGPVAPGGG